MRLILPPARPGADRGRLRDETCVTPPATAAVDPSVTVEHKYGSTMVESEPERVVTVGYTDQDATLAVGVVLVGVGDFLGGYDWRAPPWAQEALGGAKPRSSAASRSTSRPSWPSAGPDHRDQRGPEEGDYDKLSRIAPTVAHGRDIDFGMPGEEQTMLVARALGREERGREVVDEVEANREGPREHPSSPARANPAYGGPDGYGGDANGDTEPLPHRPRLELPRGRRAGRRRLLPAFSGEQFPLLTGARRDVGAEQDVLATGVKRLDAASEERKVLIDLTDEFVGALVRLRAEPRLCAGERGGRAERGVDGEPGTPGRAGVSGLRAPQRARAREPAAIASEIQPEATSRIRPAGTSARPS